MTDIFRFTDYRHYLRTWFAEENTRREAAGRARLTHRKLAELAGASSSATLAQILDHGRPLTDAVAQKLRLPLGLSDTAFAYLLLMTRMERADLARERAREALKETRAAREATEASAQAPNPRVHGRALRHEQVAERALESAEAAFEGVEQAMVAARLQRQVEVMDAERLRLVSHWMSLAVLELARCEGFRAEPTWIAQALCAPATDSQVMRTMSALDALGYSLEGAQPLGLMRTATQVPASAVRDYYLSLIDRVSHAVADHFDPEKQAFQAQSRLGAITVAVPADGLPRLHEALARAQSDLHTLAESLPGRRDTVVQVYLHMFPISERTVSAD